MAFLVHDMAIECVRAMRDAVERVRQTDPDLGDQLRRAASSMVLNIAEGRWRIGKDRLNRFRIAAGSANETRVCLLLAEAWGIVTPESARPAINLLDRLLAMMWRLLHPRIGPTAATPEHTPLLGNDSDCESDAVSGSEPATDPDPASGSDSDPPPIPKD